ncbi:hypothetical protein ACLOJK_034777 [Asimina triloba]
MMDPGEDSGASTSYPRLSEWEEALSLPDNQETPDCLRAHVAKQLTILFNIGRPVTLSEKTCHSYIEPLALDVASVGFCKALLERVSSLRDGHWNWGRPSLFCFETKSQKDRLYSGVSPKVGVMGTCFSVLIRMELARLGVERDLRFIP